MSKEKKNWKFLFPAEEEAIACSHERSYFYFMESINNPCPFKAWNCASLDEFHDGHCLKCDSDTCSRMGYYADQYLARGKMYLETASSASFCGKRNSDSFLIQICRKLTLCLYYTYSCSVASFLQTSLKMSIETNG